MILPVGEYRGDDLYNTAILLGRDGEEVGRYDKTHISQPEYLIYEDIKGGITSSDVATKALDVKAARVLGQVIPGVPVWKLVSGSLWPGLSYVVFPGKVGSDEALADLVREMRAG